MSKFFLLIIFFPTNFLFSQSNFELEDLNPSSEFYGQVIGPADFLGEISIIFFGHEYWNACRNRFDFLNLVYNDLLAIGIDDVNMIGVGKDEYNSSLDGMIDQNILPWVEDSEEEGYPVWEDYEAVQRSTYFLNRQGDLIYQFNIPTLNPEDPEDYSDFINLILDFRANNGPNVLRVSEA